MNSPFPVPYCMNVHDASSWSSIQTALDSHVLAVKQLVSPHQPFPLSLHVGQSVAKELYSQNLLPALRNWLHQQDCFVAAINAFPFGGFHENRVKAHAYRPDWRNASRLQYSEVVASLLASLLPEGGEATFTTVPGGWLPDWRSPNDPLLAVQHLTRAAEFCRALNSKSGRRIRIAIEPEPGCAWELFDPILEQIGDEICWCLDTCHAAVEFQSIEDLDWRRIGRVQLSAAIECDNTPDARAALAPFAEPRYLHQTRASLNGQIIGEWPDLALALKALPKLPPSAIVRTHYHVPLTWEGTGPLRSTRHNLTPKFMSQARHKFCEVETYTYSVLPPALCLPSLEHAIAGELQWAAHILDDSPPSSLQSNHDTSEIHNHPG